MEETLNVRIRKTIAAMNHLRAKADQTVERCGGETQVGVICYAHDAVSPLFHGNPSLKAVLERHNAGNVGTSLDTVQALDQAMANINLQNLSPHELRALQTDLQNLHLRLAPANDNNNQA